MSITIHFNDDTNRNRLEVALQTGGVAEFLDTIDPEDVDFVEFEDEDD